MGKQPVDITGQKFNRLLAIRFSHIDNKKYSHWVFLCDCGKEVIRDKHSVVREKTKSCGCLHRELASKVGKITWKKAIKFAHLSIRNADRQLALLTELLCSYKKTAKDRNYSFDLSIDTFKSLVTSPCFYCGDSLKNIRKDKASTEILFYTGIDRLDNSKGYTTENCVPCCRICNGAKSNMTKEEFLNHIEKIYVHSIKEINEN
jgi:hypothetical protein